ncbi:hypothetical protein AVEN_274544-1 [Araneus ventricosus]|uniref:Histone-lysine N-methyltransferase SETMAR n=1 Tax=Araneus ventricosus TaxID=182803 RepID=A0A4Y2HC52_ARAVE|nr:hypothetical protein AVEN_257298-1 [Araneus ventricosus]GBM62878.1 hypothetical protein AVEN_274544-1 [Araneus ventricosus]
MGVKASKTSIRVGDPLRPHTATLVKRFLAEHGATELSHPPYSPDLLPTDFFLFPKLKVTLKGRSFTDITHIQAAETKRRPMPDAITATEPIGWTWDKLL